MAILSRSDIYTGLLWQRRALRNMVGDILEAERFLKADRRERLRKEASGLLFFTPYRPPEGVLRFFNIRCDQLAHGGDWVEFMLVELIKLRPDPAEIMAILGITPARYRECGAGLNSEDDFFILQLVLAGAESQRPLLDSQLISIHAPLRASLMASCEPLVKVADSLPTRKLLPAARKQKPLRQSRG